MWCEKHHSLVILFVQFEFRVKIWITRILVILKPCLFHSMYVRFKNNHFCPLPGNFQYDGVTKRTQHISPLSLQRRCASLQTIDRACFSLFAPACMARHWKIAMVGTKLQRPDWSTALYNCTSNDISVFKNAAQRQVCKIKYGSLFPFGIMDVRISATDDQPTAKGESSVNTQLIGIGAINTLKMDVKQIHNWGNWEEMNL